MLHWLDVFPNPVEAGKEFRVRIIIKDGREKSDSQWQNHEVKIVDNKGVKWWPKEDAIYTGPGYQLYGDFLKLYYGYTMDVIADFPGVSENATFYLKVDGEILASTRVNVVYPGPINASMNCDPAIVPLTKSTTCTVHLILKRPETITLELKEVDFGGKRVWPNGPSSVRVNKQTVTLTPTTRQGELSITINIDEELADYYFGHWGYTHKLLESPSYLVEVYLTNLSYPVSDVITLTEKKGDWKDWVANLVRILQGAL